MPSPGRTTTRKLRRGRVSPGVRARHGATTHDCLDMVVCGDAGQLGGFVCFVAELELEPTQPLASSQQLVTRDLLSPSGGRPMPSPHTQIVRAPARSVRSRSIAVRTART